MQRKSAQVHATRSQAARSTRRTMVVSFLSLLVLAVVVASCAPTGAAPAAQATALSATAMPATALLPTSAAVTPQAQETAAATPASAGSSTSSSGGTLVNLASKANFGLYLVDDKGMTLYMFTKDTPNTSNCYDECATAWPPLLTGSAPAAGTGIVPSLLGTTTRKDGKAQVTYNGSPLYTFAKDQKPGDITGQGVGGVWFVLSPRGSGMTSSKAPGQGTPQAMTVFKPQPTPSGPAALKSSQSDKLGEFLVDDAGMSLYLYNKDTPNTSTCYDQCAVLWPPLLTNGAPVAGAGLDASLLGTTTRKDGATQVTYKGWPLYHWFRDQKPGDTTGQWVGGTWFVISPAGETVTAGKPPATAAPVPTAAPTAAPASGGGYGG